MTGKRAYDDPCALARGLDVIGERWAMLVVRELLLGPKRFSDLSRGLPTMSENVLSQRLRELEQAGVVSRRRLGPPAAAGGYELTALGAQLEPVVLAVAAWGARFPVRSTAGLSVDAFILAMRTMFAPAAAGDASVEFELRIGADRFRGSIGGGELKVARGGASASDRAVDIVLESDVATFTALGSGELTVEDAVDKGELSIEGDRGAAEFFIGCFLSRSR